MKEFPIIETKDLTLRELSLNDYENYLDYVTDEEIAKQFLFNYNEETCKKRLEEIVNKYQEERKPFIWAIALKETNELIGIISLDAVSFRNKSFSIACGMREKYRNQGYAYQATAHLIDYIFTNYDMHRLQLAHREDIIASGIIFEKLGATYEGISRQSKVYQNSFANRKIYSILKPEWEEAKTKKLTKF